MGEIADAMLDGTFCEGCGEVFDDILNGAEAPGFPRRCAACGGDCDDAEEEAKEYFAPRKCPQCGKAVKGQRGLIDHQRAKHALKGEDK